MLKVGGNLTKQTVEGNLTKQTVEGNLTKQTVGGNLTKLTTARLDDICRCSSRGGRMVVERWCTAVKISLCIKNQLELLNTQTLSEWMTC